MILRLAVSGKHAVFRIQDSGCKIQDAGCRIENLNSAGQPPNGQTGSTGWMQDAGCRIENLNSAGQPPNGLNGLNRLNRLNGWMQDA